MWLRVCVSVSMYVCLCLLAFIARVHAGLRVHSCVSGSVCTCVKVFFVIFRFIYLYILYVSVYVDVCMSKNVCVCACTQNIQQKDRRKYHFSY